MHVDLSNAAIGPGQVSPEIWRRAYGGGLANQVHEGNKCKTAAKNGFAQPGFKDRFSDCLPEPRVEVDQHSDAYLYRRKVVMKRIQNVIVLLG